MKWKDLSTTYSGHLPNRIFLSQKLQLKIIKTSAHSLAKITTTTTTASAASELAKLAAGLSVRLDTLYAIIKLCF